MVSRYQSLQAVWLMSVVREKEREVQSCIVQVRAAANPETKWRILAIPADLAVCGKSINLNKYYFF